MTFHVVGLTIAGHEAGVVLIRAIWPGPRYSRYAWYTKLPSA
jgi:hypothetical protein